MEYVAITGSKGFIGSVLAKHCKERGYNVLGVDHLYGSSQSNIYYNKYPYVDVALGACISSPDFASLCQHYKVSKVYHLAASADVALSQQLPFHFYENNVGNTSAMLHNLINFGWLSRKPQIVYSSTAAVYKESSRPVNEKSDKGSPNAYGRSKLMSEALLKELFDFFGVPSTTFRYFNVAGARGDVGDHFTSHHILPVLCRSALRGKKFKLYGDDYFTSDGTCIRDFIDVNDVCRAHFTASEYMYSNPGAHVYNLGTQYGTSILELIHKFEDIVKIDVNYEVAERRNGDPAFLVADPTKFIEETGFSYSSNLESMIVSTWEYLSSISSNYEGKNAF